MHASDAFAVLMQKFPKTVADKDKKIFNRVTLTLKSIGTT